MRLGYKTTKYKDRIDKPYFIAESYREGDKVKKRIFLPVGKLTDAQCNQISFVCKAIFDLPQRKSYLELTVSNIFREECEFSQAFGNDFTSNKLPYPLIAKVLTANRCVVPCANYSIPQWISNNLL